MATNILDSFDMPNGGAVKPASSSPILDSFKTAPANTPVLSQGDGQPVKPYPTGETLNPNLADYFKASFSDDPKALIKVLSQKTGVPENHFGRIDGKMGYLDPYTKTFNPVKEDWFESGQQFISGMASEVPTAAASAIGASLGGMAGGVPGFIAGGAGGGFIGSHVKQKVGEYWMDDPVDYGPMIFDTAAGAIGGLVSGVARSYKLRQVARDINQLDTASTARIRESARKWGIDLTPAEISNLPSLVSQQRLLSMAFDTADIAKGHYNKVEGQIHKALSDYLDTVSLQKNAMDGERRGVRATIDYIKGMKNTRAEATESLYTEAELSGVELDASDVMSYINSELKDAAGGTKSTLSSIKKDFYEEVTLDDGTVERVLKTEVKPLHNILKDVQAKIKQADKLEDGSKAHTLRQLHTRLEHLIESNVDAAKQARTTYSALSDIIGETEGGIVGDIARIKAEKGRFATNLLFDTKNKINADTVVKVKQVFDAADQGAWDDFVRSHIQNIMERKFKDNVKGTATIGTVLRRELMGSQEQRKVMKAALGEERYAAFHDLMEVIEATSRVGVGGSDTALKQEAQRTMRDESMGSLRGFLSFLASPLDGMDKLLTDTAYNRYKVKLANAIFDPEWHGKLRILRGLSTSEDKFAPLANAFFADLLLQAPAKGIGAAYSDIPLRSDGQYLQYIQNNPQLFGGQK